MGAIATSLNTKGIETWRNGSHWHRSYIKKILSNPSSAEHFNNNIRQKVKHDVELGGKGRREF